MSASSDQLVDELGDTMLIDDELRSRPPEEVFELARQAKTEAFRIAVFLQRFLHEHGQPQGSAVERA